MYSKLSETMVSIIIPTYNRANLIGETLDSIIAQTYENWECVVVDDGSDDNTDEVLKKYCDKDSRIQYYHRPEEHLPGGNGARNYGFKLAKGEYINWFDSDDLMVENRLELMMNKFFDNPNLDFCLSDSIVIDNNHNILTYLRINNGQKGNLFERYILKKIKFSTINPLFKRDFIENKDLFNEKTLRGQEFEFFSKLFYNYDKIFGVVNLPLVKTLINQKSITSSYFKGNSSGFESYFVVLRGILKIIDKKSTEKEFLKYYKKELLHAVRLQNYYPVFLELIFLVKRNLKSIHFKELLRIILWLILVFLIQVSNGRLYYRFKVFLQ